MSETSPESPLAVAKLLRHHKALKQRKGLLQNRPIEFFRYKRFIRALKSDQYTKKSNNQPDLYPIIAADDKDESARNVFISLIKSQLIVPVIKLHSHECKDHDLKPNKDHPHLILTQKALLEDDAYYAWNHNPKSWLDILSVFGIITVILTLVCFPLWPRSMRRGSYYLSLGALGLLGLFFVLAFIRLIIYLISLAFFKQQGGFWLFPNLFEDCGIFDSFKPLYGFGEEGNYTYIKKLKKKKKKQAEKDGVTTEKSKLKSKSKKQITEKGN
ncbi:hypothetical protein Kpol_1048p44 [Vanderwaltozyma polyspora DSM 70294]|uniref:Translocation protein SEC62 n=1 Tax=Vanderwaltozyma polyspora (strain ATCC 22028 / DSM 70294 / BCRC 21397 / CBS 2163 / NBRC 10782 / NRRL Y-8283 / UCD 57-17) TaxID=436907 RepID=A7TGK6_VANPO|nr:uncharacterized protein Kpol_1048p44 [Vanderwaltozyma polyspora DSM 70294]EDO18613.1 hypothetical protein Kpol_1048p44 [Vanderwaltozyma polyspora DSM 70294]